AGAWLGRERSATRVEDEAQRGLGRLQGASAYFCSHLGCTPSWSRLGVAPPDAGGVTFVCHTANRTQRGAPAQRVSGRPPHPGHWQPPPQATSLCPVPPPPLVGVDRGTDELAQASVRVAP